ncbi:34913_t:CDS:1 [Racocetra persica]|uniref:34913_t:CDS:1 n=1 Tax=Racocetra persica TaxID=160502 RepID=A0ACA9KLP6_9GLOM|nr:34913_t:CDS:1 [Racocetra persica]
MSEIKRHSRFIANSGIFRPIHDANQLARSYNCGRELSGFQAMLLVVIPECHRHHIRNKRTIKHIATCIWNEHATSNDKEYFIGLADQINLIKMPNMQHTALSRAIFYGTTF